MTNLKVTGKELNLEVMNLCLTVKNMIKLAMIVKCLKSVLEGTIRTGLIYPFTDSTDWSTNENL